MNEEPVSSSKGEHVNLIPADQQDGDGLQKEGLAIIKLVNLYIKVNKTELKVKAVLVNQLKGVNLAQSKGDNQHGIQQ